mmetsp:Transcript_3677/g.7796  ORF Transcript_3677/g.7796 Transcript_3677/m.7796 type:complete len:714 (+) Transcript_3677:92-2233(+)
MSTRAKLGGICLLSYAIGVLLSPYFLPTDFLTVNVAPLFIDKRLLSAQHISITNDDALNNEEDELELPPMKYEAPYKQVIGDDDDPFHGVDIVLHRNGEPDPCMRQQQQQQQSQLDGDASSSFTLLEKLLERLGVTIANDNSDDAAAPSTPSKETLSPLSQSILRSTEQFAKPLSFDSKYDLDATLTHAFATNTQSIFSNAQSSCGPTWEQDPTKPHYLDQVNENYNLLSSYSSLLKYCDMGIDRTPIQPDHNNLVRLAQVKSLPCTFHTREGLRVTSLSMLVELAREVKSDKSGEGECGVGDNNEESDQQTCTSGNGGDGGNARKELHLYAVSAGRVFMFAPKHVGEVFELPHVKGPQGLPVSLQVMSLTPRVFDIYNFFNRDESAAIVDKALKETSETHKMKRSSTGASGYNLNSKRTSENGFDTHGKEAQIVKRRCMDILGFDEYEESLTDGLQVLRYNKTTGYFPHMDWIDDPRKKEEHNFDSAGIGSNRFATILLYMSDLEAGDGGETLFSHGWPAGQAEEEHVQLDDAIDALRASGDVEGILKRDSWEEKMVANCRSRLAVRPHSSRAVLFYSQHPDGSVDQSSLHGGCPVITDQPKWAANLWAWNSIRGGFPGSPKNEHVVEKNRAANKSPENDQQKHATFINDKSDESMRHAQLFFQDTFWGNYGFDDPPLGINTFKGHKWHVRVDGEVVKSFTIGRDKKQEFHI